MNQDNQQQVKGCLPGKSYVWTFCPGYLLIKLVADNNTTLRNRHTKNKRRQPVFSYIRDRTLQIAIPVGRKRINHIRYRVHHWKSYYHNEYPLPSVVQKGILTYLHGYKGDGKMTRGTIFFSETSL